MLGRSARGLALVAVLLWGQASRADEILSYLNLSSKDKLHSQVGLFLGDDGASIKANLTLEGAGGRTRVLPSVTSRFKSGDWLDVSSVFTYGDWNAAAGSSPTVATKIVLQSGVPVIERIEGSVRHTAHEVSQSLRFGFADFGVQALGGTPINVKTALTLGSGSASAAPSSLSSSITMGSAVDLRTVWQFAADGYDTRLTYRTSAAVVDQVVAGLKRTPNGELAQSIGVRFPDVSRSRDIGPALRVTSGATLEETLAPNGVETLRMGFETSIAGMQSALLGGNSKLSLKLEQPLDEAHTQRASFAYDHAWAPRDETSIALNLKMLREAGEVEPTLGVSWRSRF